MDDTEAKYMVEFPDNEHGMIVVSDATPHQAALKACRKADWDTTDFPIAKKGECHCVVTDLILILLDMVREIQMASITRACSRSILKSCAT